MNFLTSSNAKSWLIAAKSSLMTLLGCPIFGEFSPSSLVDEELLLVSSSEVPIPSSWTCSESENEQKSTFQEYVKLFLQP